MVRWSSSYRIKYSLLLVQTESLLKQITVLYKDGVWDEKTHGWAASASRLDDAKWRVRREDGLVC